MARKDLSISFKKHPITKDIGSISGTKAVDQSIKNIVLTNFNEIKRNPSFGTNTRAQLFELANTNNAQVLKTDISNALSQYEPDAEIISVQVVVGEDYESIDVRIIYTYRNDPTEQTTLISLET